MGPDMVNTAIDYMVIENMDTEFMEKQISRGIMKRTDDFNCVFAYVCGILNSTFLMAEEWPGDVCNDSTGQ